MFFGVCFMCLFICFVLFVLLFFVGCVGLLLQLDLQMVWVELCSVLVNILLVECLDGEWLSDGCYFQVILGCYVLEVCFQYEFYGGFGGGGGGFGELVQINCYQQVVYDGFEVGWCYCLEVCL